MITLRQRINSKYIYTISNLFTRQQNSDIPTTTNILSNAFGGTFAFFFNAQAKAKKIQKSHQANAPRHDKQ